MCSYYLESKRDRRERRKAWGLPSAITAPRRTRLYNVLRDHKNRFVKLVKRLSNGLIHDNDGLEIILLIIVAIIFVTYVVNP